MITGRNRATWLALAVAAVTPLLPLGGNAPASGAAKAATRPTTTLSHAPTATISTTTTLPPSLVTIQGQITKMLADGSFEMSDGTNRYTVALPPTTKIVDLKGADVVRGLIVAGIAVQVTGALSGTQISAQNVLIPNVPGQV